ncbi:FtsX-like permease family protein [Candidatus Hydrogenedentota bacterium]
MKKTILVKSTALIILVAVTLATSASAMEVESRITTESLRKEVETFASFGSRAVGYEGLEQAAQYVEKRFGEIGLGNIRIQEFLVPGPVEKSGLIRVGGRDYPMHCLWPNRVRTSTIPPPGIDTNLIYGADGDLSWLDGMPIEGNAVLLDWESQLNWLTLGNLGARAIVFLPPREGVDSLRAQSKYVSVPLDLPRFYLDPGVAEQVLAEVKGKNEGATVHLEARMDWENFTCKNIFGMIPGTDPELEGEHLVIEAYYDASSFVPAVCPGAEQSLSITSLLHIAELLADNPSKRPVIIAAFSGHFTSLEGGRKFGRDLVTYKKYLRNGGENEKNAEVLELYRSLFPDMTQLFFTSLELTSGGRQIGLFTRGNFYGREVVDTKWQQTKPRYFPVSVRMEEKARELEENSGMFDPETFINGIKAKQNRDFQAFQKRGAAPDSDAVQFSNGRVEDEYHTPTIFLYTCYDMKDNYWSPLDLVEDVDFDTAVPQARMAALLFKDFADSADYDFDFGFQNSELRSATTLGRVYGRAVWFNPKESFIPDSALEGAVVFLDRVLRQWSEGTGTTAEDIVGEVLNTTLRITGKNGEFDFENYVPCSRQWNAEILVEAYGIDNETGSIIYAPDEGQNGEERYPARNVRIANKDKREVTAVVFKCESAGLFGLLDPRYLDLLRNIEVVDAMTKTSPKSYSYCRALRFGSRTSSHGDTCAVVFSKPEDNLTITMSLGIVGRRLVLCNSSEEEPDGIGYPLSDHKNIYNTEYHVARDMWHLDEGRIRKHANVGITNARINDLHSKAKEYIEAAEDAKKRNAHNEFLDLSQKAWAYESRAYTDVKATGDDAVKGVIFYLVVLLPFVFFAERLLFSFADVRIRVLGWVSIFLVIFLIFRYIHPAFKITVTPYIILLAFLLLALSVLVIIMGLSRFKVEMRKIKGELTGITATDVSRAGAMMTAFNLGIGNMRRRPVRSAMTAVTLILITFSILSFTSVREYLRINKVKQRWESSYDGILVRSIGWQALNFNTVDVLEREFGGEHAVAPRFWFSDSRDGKNTSITSIYLPIEVEGQPVQEEEKFLSGVLGLSAAESDVTGIDKLILKPGYGRWMKEGERQVCLLPSGFAESLGLGPDDVDETYVTIVNKRYKLIGIFDEDAFMEFRDLDDQELSPVDYVTMPQYMTTQGKTGEDNTGQTTFSEYNHAKMDLFAIMPHQDVRHLGHRRGSFMNGTLRSVGIGFTEGTNVEEAVTNFVKRTAMTVAVGDESESYLYSSIGATGLSGMGNLILPIIISALIVLNTMLGSVHEKVKEIGIYSSVGLAPNHIAMLFIAEAAIYSVIGGVLGYLLGQVVSKILQVWPILPGLSLNYSSTSVVFCILFVMATVFLSTLYPAKKASDLAVPDIQRKWKLPVPDGDGWEFQFPFTVRTNEAIGLNEFLMSFFRGRMDKDLGGSFTVQDVSLAKVDEEFQMKMKCWLAPYDFGVSQTVKITTRPDTELPGTMNIIVGVKRLSGESKAWLRVNRPFLNNFRKQFLLWKTVSDEDKNGFIARGEAALDLKPETQA